MKEKIVVVGMSGGVDSAVAACLLKEQGYKVIGATMLLLDTVDAKKAVEDAKKICKQLGISHYTFNLVNEFKETVIKNFITSYQQAETPNPCVLCNRIFKFDLFYENAQKLNASYIATGHYAKIVDDFIVMSDVLEKDQTYFLCQIKKEIIPHVLFPLNQYQSKEQIRNLARKYNLSISEKKESQEICFIPNDDYKCFLKNYDVKSTSGNIILKDGTILGKHNGLYNYTIGQRKGLNISYKEALYVIELDEKTNSVVVGSNSDLFKQELIIRNMNYLVDKELFFTLELYGKVRSRAKLEKISSVKEIDNELIYVCFEHPQRAFTPGQLITFYDKNKRCLGGGYIIKK